MIYFDKIITKKIMMTPEFLYEKRMISQEHHIEAYLLGESNHRMTNNK